MKTLSAISLLILFLLNVQTMFAGPEITFKQQEVDYGLVQKGDNGVREFVFFNTGDEPLIVFQCQATCSCYHANCPENAIMPGDSGILEAVYDTQKIGPFIKSITVTCNAEVGMVRLKIKGEILDDTDNK